MASIKTVAAGGLLAALVSGSALAADLLPPPPPLPAAPVAVEFGGWYLRGDIGVSSQNVDRLENPALDQAFPAAVEVIDKSFDSAPTIGAGVGYQVNSFLRFDATLEYRARASFSALDRYAPVGTTAWIAPNEYTARKSEVVGLVNAYVDLGTWYGITPFVGAGIGVSHVMIDGFKDTNVATGGLAYSESADKTNFAWALYAGLGYQVSPGLALELAYRYIHLGDGQTGNTVTYTGGDAVPDAWHLKGIDSHDFKIGMRWLLNAPVAVPVHRPLITKF